MPWPADVAPVSGRSAPRIAPWRRGRGRRRLAAPRPRPCYRGGAPPVHGARRRPGGGDGGRGCRGVGHARGAAGAGRVVRAAGQDAGAGAVGQAGAGGVRRGGTALRTRSLYQRLLTLTCQPARLGSAQTRQGQAAPGPALLKESRSRGGSPLAEFEAGLNLACPTGHTQQPLVLVLRGAA